MRKVRVHLNDDISAVCQRVFEALDVRRAEAELGAALKQADAARVFGNELLREGAGAVGRAIVDDQDVDGKRQSPEGLGHLAHVVRLVVGGDDDSDFHESKPGANPAIVEPLPDLIKCKKGDECPKTKVDRPVNFRLSSSA